MLCTLAALCSTAAIVAAAARPLTSPFNAAARWISPVGRVANGTFAAYLHNFSTASATGCNSSTLYVAADTKYWLFVNGELVVFEGTHSHST